MLNFDVADRESVKASAARFCSHAHKFQSLIGRYPKAERRVDGCPQCIPAPRTHSLQMVEDLESQIQKLIKNKTWVGESPRVDDEYELPHI